MQKRKPVHILTFAAAIAFASAPMQTQAADSSLDSMWNDQVKGSSNTSNKGTPPDTTPYPGADPAAAAAGNAASDMGTTPDTGAASTTPDTGAATSTMPDTGAATSTMPDTGAATSTTPDTGAATSTMPDTGAAASTMPDTGAAAATTLDATAPSGSASGDERSPLCTLDAFRQSDLVQFSSWPGVGPFRGAAPDFTDPNQNRITVDLNKDKVTSAQLSVADAPSDLLKLQMSADFLLESVGARAGKIASFNEQLEKMRPQLATSTSSDPLNLTAGSYLVYIYPQNQTTDSLNYIIKINSKDATNDVIRHSIPIAVAPPRVTPRATSSPDETGSAKNNSSDLKNQFADLINNWQTVKKAAVRQRETSGLSTVLSGKALQMQSKAVKWLSDNHKYYEMNAKNVFVDHYLELVKDQKYAVYAQVSEEKKYIDDTNDAVLKETTDTYSVNYTVEKIGDHWFITDSEVLNAPSSINKAQTKASR